ncbi:uncharacterized protein LOC110754899 [Prunus avium]|uniref:Uncharacterized protein LOC110754899 n=1 Tax=Prunus avium TaxID=42229 RepID=A0A6P5SDX6_PRUAV|nr:uncharacterized protein LOC110754899 [Prunus avium]
MSFRNIGEKAGFAWKRLKSMLPLRSGAQISSEEGDRTSGFGLKNWMPNFSGLKNPGMGLGKWVPHLYVNNSDYICCSYTEHDGAEVNNADKENVVLVPVPVLCLSYLLRVVFVSAAIMGDDSIIVTGTSASTPKEARPSRDYSTPLTSDKLDGSNYASWSRGARITITSRRMASWINGKKPAPSQDSTAYAEWEEDNCLVQSWLLNSITKPVRALFEHGDTAFYIWEAAQKTYTVTQNSSRLFQLRRQSILIGQNGESVKVFYEKLHAIWQEIDCLRPNEFSCSADGARRLKEIEADRVYDFLGGLDPPYDGVRSRILALSPIPPPLEAYVMVMEEDTRQSAMLGGGSMALKVDPARHRPVSQHDATGRAPSRKFGSSAGSRPSAPTSTALEGPLKCHHYSEKCFKEHGCPDWFANYKARMYGPKATYTVTPDEAHPPAPFANLCASDTMAVLMAYLPQLLVKDLRTHEKIGHGKRIGGLYYLQLPAAAVRDCVANKALSGSVKDKQQLWLWHRRLGHPSIGYLRHLFPSLFSSCDEFSFKCETCVMAKSHCTVFPLSNNKAALPFELVHSDVWGLAHVTSHGFRWFVTFIDDCTRVTWVYLMKDKHDVASILPDFYAMVSTQFHARVKVFRTDNGGEYVNHTLAQFFRDQGIIHQTTTPFTPQQNGVSERKNCQLLEVARSLVLDMSAYS